MKIKPRNQYVLVKRDEAESRENQYGLLTPTSVEQEEKAFGTVVAVGTKVEDIKKGDRVVYGAYAGEEMELEEKGVKVKYRLLEEEFIIAFID